MFFFTQFHSVGPKPFATAADFAIAFPQQAVSYQMKIYQRFVVSFCISVA